MAKQPAQPAGHLTDPEHIHTQLKISLSKLTGFRINEIFPEDHLLKKYGFTPASLTVLARNLEADFAHAGSPIPKRLDRDAIVAARTVHDLHTLILSASGVSLALAPLPGTPHHPPRKP